MLSPGLPLVEKTYRSVQIVLPSLEVANLYQGLSLASYFFLDTLLPTSIYSPLAKSNFCVLRRSNFRFACRLSTIRKLTGSALWTPKKFPLDNPRLTQENEGFAFRIEKNTCSRFWAVDIKSGDATNIWYRDSCASSADCNRFETSVTTRKDVSALTFRARSSTFSRAVELKGMKMTAAVTKITTSEKRRNNF